MDPHELLSWRVPEIRQELTREDTAFYALSVGLGQDPLDPDQLHFVDPNSHKFAALPSMALVMAYPGLWMADPATGIDVVRMVHAEQTLETWGALPTEGVVTSQTRVTGLIGRGASRGTMLYSEREIRDGAGRRIALLRQTHMLRGNNGFAVATGRPQAPRPVAAGEPTHRIVLPTRPEQALLYRLNGDMNPIHADRDAAERAGFPRPLLHGMCTFGIVAHAILRALCDYRPARLRSISLRFSGPVYPGETISTEIHHDGTFRARVVERDQTVVDYGYVVLG